MNRKTFRLVNNAVRQRAIDEVWGSPQGYVCIVQEETRNLAQNSALHRICTELEKLGIEWGGRAHTKEAWKVLLVSAHAVATTGEAPEVVQGIEGELVNLRESTATMGKSRGSSLIAYAECFLETHRAETV